MLFLFGILSSSFVFELDIQFCSIEIVGDENDDYFTVFSNNLQFQMQKRDDILITGTSINKNFLNISITDPKNPLNLVFDSLSFLNENPSIYIQGECIINISIGNNVEISSINSYPIVLSENSNLYLSGQNKGQILNLKSYSNYSMIGGNGNIFLKNISLSSQNLTYSGLEGRIISIESCDINLSTYQETIGGRQSNLITIQSSNLSLKSEFSSCIGNSQNIDSNISIESSIIYASTASINAPCIGNNQSNQIIIMSSQIEASIENEESTFPIIGSSLNIKIESSDIFLKATKGSAIGGGLVEDMDTLIDITNSYINASSSGNSATIGGGETKMTLKINIVDHSRVFADNLNLLGTDGSAIGGGSRTIIDSIYIENSVVNASSAKCGAAIGSGNQLSGSFVESIGITSSQVFAENKGDTNQYCSAGIGGNLKNEICIVDSNLTAKGGYFSAGIGSSKSCQIGDIVIIRSNIEASSMSAGAAIGGSSQGSVNNITIIESTIDAFAGKNQLNQEVKGAAIGGGYLTTSNFILIRRSKVKAVSGWSSSAAAIGGGLMASAGNIVIEDSSVVAVSSLNASICSHSNNGGAAIGTGASANFDNGTIVIRRSNISAFGSNIHTESSPSSPLICGAAIGHGGATLDARFDHSGIEILIENSIVFAYGGNATSSGTAASSAFLGGLVMKRPSEGMTKIVNSTVFAVSGSAVSTSSNVATSSFGWNFVPNYDELAGELSIENSKVYGNNADSSKGQYLAIVFDRFELSGSSEVEFHSSKNVTVVANYASYSNSLPLLTLSNLKELNASSLTVFGARINYERRVELGVNDDSVSFSLPLAGEKYFLSARIDGSSKKLRNGDRPAGEDHLSIADGDNFFNNLRIVSDATENTSSVEIETVSDDEIDASQQNSHQSELTVEITPTRPVFPSTQPNSPSTKSPTPGTQPIWPTKPVSPSKQTMIPTSQISSSSSASPTTQTSSSLSITSSASLSQQPEDDGKGTDLPQKRQNVPLILGLAIGVPVAVGVIVFCVATFIILRKRANRDPYAVAPIEQPSNQNMTQPLNENELENIP